MKKWLVLFGITTFTAYGNAVQEDSIAMSEDEVVEEKTSKRSSSQKNQEKVTKFVPEQSSEEGMIEEIIIIRRPAKASSEQKDISQTTPPAAQPQAKKRQKFATDPQSKQKATTRQAHTSKKRKMVVDNEDAPPPAPESTEAPVKQGDGWDGHRPPIYANGVSISGEFLWWQVKQEASEFVAGPVTVPVALQGHSSDTLGKYHSASFDWNPGVRVDFGYTFKRDAWQLLGEYTYFQTHGRTTVTRSEDGTSFIFAPFADVSGTGTRQAISHIDLWYNAADLLLARRFLVSEQILLKFAMGATGAWIKEDWHINYDKSPIMTVVKNDWDFKGGGIRVKLDSRWHLGKGFGFFNKISAAVLLGSYFNHNEVSSEPPVAGFLDPIRNTRYRNNILVPMTQFGLGLDWNKAFKKVSFRIGAGVEVNTWFDLQEVYKDTQGVTGLANDHKDARDTSNVNLYGLNATLGFDF